MYNICRFTFLLLLYWACRRIDLRWLHLDQPQDQSTHDQDYQVNFKKMSPFGHRNTLALISSRNTEQNHCFLLQIYLLVLKLAQTSQASFYILGDEFFQLLMGLGFAKKGMTKNTHTVLDYITNYKFYFFLNFLLVAL